MQSSAEEHSHLGEDRRDAECLLVALSLFLPSCESNAAPSRTLLLVFSSLIARANDGWYAASLSVLDWSVPVFAFFEITGTVN